MLKMSAPRPVFGPKERSLSAPSPGFWAEGPVLRDKMLLQSNLCVPGAHECFLTTRITAEGRHQPRKTIMCAGGGVYIALIPSHSSLRPPVAAWLPQNLLRGHFEKLQ